MGWGWGEGTFRGGSDTGGGGGSEINNSWSRVGGHIFLGIWGRGIRQASVFIKRNISASGVRLQNPITNIFSVSLL